MACLDSAALYNGLPRAADSGLCLRRRQKAVVPLGYRRLRVACWKRMLRQRAADLKRYAYTDCMTFYLARGLAEQAGKERPAWLARVGPES